MLLYGICVKTKHKASQVSDIYHLRWLDQYLNGVELRSIKRDLLDKILTAKKAEGVENSTANRVLEIVRAVLMKACNEWEWIDRVPMVRMLPEPTKRVRWITRNEAGRLIAAASGRHGALQSGNRFAACQCYGPAMVSGGSGAQDGMDSSRSSQGQKSDSRSTVERSGCSVAQADR